MDILVIENSGGEVLKPLVLTFTIAEAPVTAGEKLAGNSPDTASQFHDGSCLRDASLKQRDLTAIREAQIKFDGAAVASLWPPADAEVAHIGGHMSGMTWREHDDCHARD